MQIIGKTRVFRKEFSDNIAYSTSVSNKNREGEWERVYVSMVFIKDKHRYDPEIADNTTIDIKGGALSLSKSKGENKISYLVFEFDTVDENPQDEPKQDLPELKVEGFQTINDDDSFDDVPF